VYKYRPEKNVTRLFGRRQVKPQVLKQNTRRREIQMIKKRTNIRPHTDNSACSPTASCPAMECVERIDLRPRWLREHRELVNPFKPGGYCIYCHLVHNDDNNF